MTAPTVTTLPLATGHWTVDHDHSGVLFTVRHLGLSNVRGRFGQFEATLDVGYTLDQGYHLARPMPGQELLSWVANRDTLADHAALVHD